MNNNDKDNNDRFKNMDELLLTLKEKELSILETFAAAAAMFLRSFRRVAVIALPAFFCVNFLIDLAGGGEANALDVSGGVSSARIFGLIVTFLFAPLASAAATGAVRCYLSKEEPTTRRLLDFSVFMWLKMTSAMLVIAALTAAIVALAAVVTIVTYFALGVLVVAVLGGALSVYVNLAPQSVVMSDKWGFAAVPDSVRVVRAWGFWRSFWRMFVAGAGNLLFALVGGMLMWFLPFSDNIAVYALYLSCIQTACLFFTYFTALWYFNAREYHHV